MMTYWRALSAADPLRLQFWDDRGLTMAQLRLMYLVLERGGSSVGELASALGVSAATATGLTDRLVRHRLISRGDDEADRRRVVITLTSEGQALLGQISVAAEAYMAAIFAKMSDADVLLLTEVLDRFNSAARIVSRLGEGTEVKESREREDR